MKDDAHGVARSTTQATDAMAHFHAIGALGALDRTSIDSKDDGITPSEWYDFSAGLHAGALFCKDDFTAREVLVWLRQKNGDLLWENVLAVKILVQAVVISLAILAQKWRWSGLAGRMAAF